MPADTRSRAESSPRPDAGDLTRRAPVADRVRASARPRSQSSRSFARVVRSRPGTRPRRRSRCVSPFRKRRLKCDRAVADVAAVVDLVGLVAQGPDVADREVVGRQRDLVARDDAVAAVGDRVDDRPASFPAGCCGASPRSAASRSGSAGSPRPPPDPGFGPSVTSVVGRTVDVEVEAPVRVVPVRVVRRTRRRSRRTRRPARCARRGRSATSSCSGTSRLRTGSSGSAGPRASRPPRPRNSRCRADRNRPRQPPVVAHGVRRTRRLRVAGDAGNRVVRVEHDFLVLPVAVAAAATRIVFDVQHRHVAALQDEVAVVVDVADLEARAVRARCCRRAAASRTPTPGLPVGQDIRCSPLRLQVGRPRRPKRRGQARGGRTRAARADACSSPVPPGRRHVDRVGDLLRARSTTTRRIRPARSEESRNTWRHRAPGPQGLSRASSRTKPPSRTGWKRAKRRASSGSAAHDLERLLDLLRGGRRQSLRDLLPAELQRPSRSSRSFS